MNPYGIEVYYKKGRFGRQQHYVVTVPEEKGEDPSDRQVRLEEKFQELKGYHMILHGATIISREYIPGAGGQE